MKIKLKDEYEIYMYFEGKKRNMPESHIECAIEVLRLIKEL